MTKEEFRKRWDGDENGGGITFDDIADCAEEWGLYTTPRIHPIDVVAHEVTVIAGCKDIYEIYEIDEGEYYGYD